MNAAAASSGFSSDVVVSSPTDVMASISLPDTVSITLPPAPVPPPPPPPPPPPVLPFGCVYAESGDTTTYDTILPDPLGDDKSVVFTVTAGNDAHLGFFSDTQSTGEVYEIVLSGWGNTMSTIRPCNQCSNSYAGADASDGRMPTPGLLSATEARTFWASAVDGLVLFGSGDTVGADEMMRWQDPDHHVASYVGVMTGWGATGEWAVCAAGWAPPFTSQTAVFVATVTNPTLVFENVSPSGDRSVFVDEISVTQVLSATDPGTIGATVTLAADIAAIGTAEEFSSKFESDMAALLDISTDQVTVNNITAGSLVVDFSVSTVGHDEFAAVVAAMSNEFDVPGVPLGNSMTTTTITATNVRVRCPAGMAADLTTLCTTCPTGTYAVPVASSTCVACEAGQADADSRWMPTAIQQHHALIVK